MTVRPSTLELQVLSRMLDMAERLFAGTSHYMLSNNDWQELAVARATVKRLQEEENTRVR